MMRVFKVFHVSLIASNRYLDITTMAAVVALSFALTGLAGCKDQADPSPADQPNAKTQAQAEQASTHTADKPTAAENRQLSSLTSSEDQVTYSNAYFGLTVRKPDGWFAQDAAALMQMSAEGMDTVLEDKKTKEALIQATLKNTTPLFSFFSNKPGTIAENLSNVAAVAENMEGSPELKTGCDYLGQVRTLLEQGSVPAVIAPGCKTMRINGTEFGLIEVQMGSEGGGRFHQRYMACLTPTHAIGIVQTTTDERGLKMAEALMKSLRVVRCV
jgi:hypothetical protein